MPYCWQPIWLFSVRWIPSELNVADAPSRGSNVAGYIKEGKVVSDFKHILSKEGEAGDRISGHAFVPQGEEEGEASGGEETESCREKAGYQPSHRGGRNSWEESAAREAYNAGEKQYQCRAGESVPPLPEQLQGLLCGERIKVPSKIRHRPDPRRLLRHSVSRQQKCSRRRKDPGSLGVPVSQLERQASPQQTGLEGVEKTSSPKIQASLAQTCGVRDSYETAAARSSRDGTSSPPELRHVPQTGGDVRPLSEKSGEPGSWDGATIQDVHLGDPRPRGRGARQDRSLQQLFESGQSGDSDLAGAHVEEFGEKIGRQAMCSSTFRRTSTGRNFKRQDPFLGCSHFICTTLRHGGASDDLCKGHRDHAGVKDRGRWRTDSSVRRYAKTGKIQSLLQQLPEWSLSYCRRSMVKMEAVLKGITPP